MTKVSYKRGSKVKAVVAHLLEVTGKGQGRNGKSSDYNSVRKIAMFGNSTGFVTSGHLNVLGRIYNRVMKELGSRATSWRNFGE